MKYNGKIKVKILLMKSRKLYSLRSMILNFIIFKNVILNVKI